MKFSQCCSTNRIPKFAVLIQSCLGWGGVLGIPQYNAHFLFFLESFMFLHYHTPPNERHPPFPKLVSIIKSSLIVFQEGNKAFLQSVTELLVVSHILTRKVIKELCHIVWAEFLIFWCLCVNDAKLVKFCQCQVEGMAVTVSLPKMVNKLRQQTLTTQRFRGSKVVRMVCQIRYLDFLISSVGEIKKVKRSDA